MEESYCWNNSCLSTTKYFKSVTKFTIALNSHDFVRRSGQILGFKRKQLFHFLENFWLSRFKFYDNFESQEKSLLYFRHFSFSCLKTKTMLIADLPALTAWIYTFSESLQSLEDNLYRRLARNPYDCLLCVYIIMSYYSYTFAPSSRQAIHHTDV